MRWTSHRPVFEPAGNTSTQHHLVKFFWRMRPAGGGAAVSVGLDVFVRRPDPFALSIHRAGREVKSALPATAVRTNLAIIGFTCSGASTGK